MPTIPPVVSKPIWEFLRLKELPDFGGDNEPSSIPVDVIIEGDPRLTDSRTPTSHAASHLSAGSDPISIDSASQLPNSGVVAGIYTLATVQVDAKGRVTAASNGAAGAGDLLAANNLSDLADLAVSFDNIKQDATTAYKGVVELATSGENTAGVAVQGNDARLSDSRPPNGAAGGVLNGTYPNPGFAADMATQAELDAHILDTTNPHSVTKAQVGLSNADNTSDMSKPVSTAQAAADTAVANAAASALSAHTGDTGNPHSVTKTQVGLSAVTNDAQARASIYPNTVPVFAGAIPVSDGSQFIAQVLFDDLTVAATGSATITNNAVSNAKLSDMGQGTIKGRAMAAGTGDPTDLTANQVSTILDSATDPFVRSSAGSSGNVIGPATHAANKIPAWNGTPNSKTLVEGYDAIASTDIILSTDAGKIPLYDPTHGLGAAFHTAFGGTLGGFGRGTLDAGAIRFIQTSGSRTGTLVRPTLGANRTWTLQDATGTIAHTTDVAALEHTKAYFAFNGTVAGATNTAFTYSRTLTTVTVTMTAHGHLVGHMTYLDFLTGGALDANYAVVSVIDADNFTVTTAASGAIAAGSTGQEQRRAIIYSTGSNPIHSVCPNAAQVGSFYLNWTTAYATIDYGIFATASIVATPYVTFDSVEAHQTARGNISVFTFAGAPSAGSTSVHVQVVY